MKNLFLLIPLLLLSSCYTAYHKPLAHLGSEGRVVVIEKPEKGRNNVNLSDVPTLYQADGKVYVAGTRRVVKPYYRRWYWSVNDEFLLTSRRSTLKQHLQFADESAACHVYGEVKLQRQDDGTSAWVRTDDAWREQLPQGARPYASGHPYCYSSLCFADGTPDIWATSAEQEETPHSGAHALYAYPLAALAWLACDAPTYLLFHIPHAIVYPFAAVQQQVPSVPTPIPARNDER